MDGNFMTGSVLFVLVLVVLFLVIAVGAVVTLTRAESDGEVPLRDRPWWRGGPMLGAAAGLCFGTFFALFGAVDPSSGAWPVLFDRVVSVGLLAIVVVIAPRGRPSINRGGWVLLATCGGLDVTAHVLYVFAGHNGLTSEIAVLSSLYPATTVMLAVVVTRERLRLAHIVGLFAALVGVACIAMGSG